MTWFQLVDSVYSDSEPVRATKLVPNSAFFLNPTLTVQPRHDMLPSRLALRATRPSAELLGPTPRQWGVGRQPVP